MKHRGIYEIYADILNQCSNVPQVKNWLLNESRLTQRLADKSINELIKLGLLERTLLLNNHRGRSNTFGYLATASGKEYLRNYHALVGLLNLNCVRVK